MAGSSSNVTQGLVLIVVGALVLSQVLRGGAVDRLLGKH